MRGYILGICALAALLAAPAEACSYVACQGWAPDWATPAKGETIPANAPALAVAMALHPGGVPLPTMTLVGPDAATLPVTVTRDSWDPGVALVYLDAPLTPGLAVDMTATGCQVNVPWQGDFLVGPAAATPTSAGSLVVTVQIETVTVPVGTGACTGQFTGPTARLNWTPDPTLLPWLPLTQVVVSVDGKEWARTPYGPEGGKLIRKPWHFFDFDPQVVVTSCTDGPVNPAWMTPPGVAQGKHTIELQVHIAGMTSNPPPLTAKVTLNCAPNPPGADALGGADTQADGLAGADTVQVQGTPRQEPSRSGCNAGPQSGAGWLAALVVLGLAGRRRQAAGQA